MRQIGAMSLPAVRTTGADAGQVLRGTGHHNHGLRLRLSQAQQRGKDGAITGTFMILDAGHNKHAQSLAALLHRPTDAEEVLAVIRRRHAGCVHVVNTTSLVLEPGTTPDKTPREGSPPCRREGPVSDPDFVGGPPRPSPFAEGA